jgi:hypothetical protein
MMRTRKFRCSRVPVGRATDALQTRQGRASHNEAATTILNRNERT